MRVANRTKPKTDFGIEVRVFTATTGMNMKELAAKAGVKYTTLVETTTGRCAGIELIRGRAAQHGTAQSQYANFGDQPRPHHESAFPADDHCGGGGERQHRLYGVTQRRRCRGRADELSA